jgi:hypothetical protein
LPADPQFGDRKRDRSRIYIGAMCRDERGAEYIKSVDISPEGARAALKARHES